ncbi:MAG: hypothetical protein WDW38_008488 [Sanguina aurantia]
MQALSARAVSTRAFTTVRPVVLKAAINVPRVQPVRISQHASTVVRSFSVDAQDMTEYEEGGDVDIPLQTSFESSQMTSENVKLRIRLRGYEVSLLAEAIQQIRTVCQATGAVFTGPVMLPTRKKLYCVLRSPHVNKDAREHFEIRIHHRLVDLKNLSSETVAAMMQWVPPCGVELEVSIA